MSINFGIRGTLATASNFNTLNWSGGAGTFISGNSLSPTYIPGASETGIVILTLTATGNGSCALQTSTMQLTITQSPTVNAGSDQEVCRNTTFNFSTQSTLATATNFNTIAWTTTGSGTFTNTSTLTPTYVPGVAESGAVTFTLTATGNGSCVTIQDQMVLTVTPQVVVNAGSNAETCKGVSINFGTRTTLATASNLNTLSWSGGAGTFISGNSLSPTYIPGASETGIVTLTLTATGNGSCALQTSTMQLTITPSPTVNAGSDQEVCRNATFNFSTQSTLATATNYNTITWTTTGSGTFTNVNTLTPTYIPGAAESGGVTFTLTATGNGSCTAVQDQMVLTVSPTLTANAGSDEQICQGATFNFASQSMPASATNFSSINWTHSGLGTLTNPTSLVPVYQPTSIEIGNVVITLTANGLGSCGTLVRTMQLTIKPSVIVNAGANAETCQGVAINFASRTVIASASNFTSLLWTHSGTGSISGAATLSPIYTPGVGESGNVTFTLTVNGIGVCPSKQSQMTLLITPLVVVDAGSSMQVCQGGTINFSTQTTLASAANYSSVVWTHTGLGSLFNANTLSPTYFTSPAETGNVTFTLKAFSTGSCPFATDVTILNIVPAPISNAGGDGEICEGTPTFDLNTRTLPASAANGSLLWTHNGAGSLSSSTTLNPVYTLAAGDFGNLVTFILRVTSGSVVCSPALDQFTLKVNRKAVVSVPANYVVCESTSIALAGNIGGTATTGLWSIVSGNGSLSATNVSGLSVTASYNVVSMDVGTTVIFRLTSNDPDGPTSPCTTAFADLSITINRAASITAGIDLAQCKDQASIALQGAIAYAPNGVLWTGGAGVFDANTSPTSNYSFANPSEINSAIPVTLTLTALDPDGIGGPCLAVSDQMRLTINPLPVVAFTGLPPGAPPNMAENQPLLTLTGNQIGGAFTISPASSNIGSTVPSPVDKASFDPGAVTIGLNVITYSYTDANSCFNFDSQQVIVNPVTSASFALLNSNGDLLTFNSLTLTHEICAEQGEIIIKGQPDFNKDGPNQFISLTSGLNIIPSGSAPNIVNKIQTNGLASGTYLVDYKYTNSLGASSDNIFAIKVYSGPQPAISATSNCVSSAIPLNGSVVIPSSPFPPTISSWNWDFGDNIFTTGQNVNHLYSSAKVYNVALKVTTSQGCSNTVTQSVRVGDVPVVNYNWSAICTNDQTIFKDLTLSGSISTITDYTWDFGDGDVLTGVTGGSVPSGTHLNRTSGTFKDPLHNYTGPGSKTVKLTVNTNDGCSNSITQGVTILIAGPAVTPNATNPYSNNFDVLDNDWFAESKILSVPGVLPLSFGPNGWLRGNPSGSTITSASSGSIAWWTGAKVLLDKSNSVAYPTYYDNEASWVNGPCFDLTQLHRPMISLDYWSDAENNIDGAVIQYSINGGIDWLLVGPLAGLQASQRDQGINWYDPNTNILSNPGQQLIGPYGWSSKSKGWRNARFNLDMVDTLKRSQVRLRVAFGSNLGNAPGVKYDGFAFDNFFIGEKKRNVLIEHFTNSSLGGSTAADTYLNTLFDNEINLRGNGDNDFNNIQYHISYSSANSDQLNSDNPNDPNARASSYGVSQPPKTFMDGIKNQKFDGTTIKLNNVEIDRRSLKDPKFKLKLDTIATGKNSFINAQLTITADTIVNVPLIAQVALVEEDVVTTAGTFKNVLRKLLFGSDATKPDGITITQPFTVGQTAVRPQPASEIEINVPIKNPRNLKLIGFIQDKNTGEIYQSTVMKVKFKTNSPITGLGDDPAVISNLKDLQIYPNPANGKFNFALPGNFPPGYVWKIADQRGIFIMKGDFNDAVNGVQTVDVSSVINGVYFILIGAEGKVPLYKKLVVMNQN
ncbi:MAG: PKD domain-containing protein [Cyclobacteriaceae bacterium]